MIAPSRYVRPSLFADLTGYTEKAVRRKIESGAWVEGVHYVRAPDAGQKAVRIFGQNVPPVSQVGKKAHK